MRDQRDQVLTVLHERKGHLYICGNTKMGLDVQHVLKEFLGEDGFKLIEKEKRLVKELWG
jgi:sulfite reductase alpha subunit-like flavoprotein